MKNRVRPTMSLPARCWGFLQAWIWILVMDLGLRCGFRSRLQSLAAGSGAGGGADPSAGAAYGQHLARLVALAARFHLHPVRCLTRALTLQYLLTRRGLSAELRIGVRMEESRLRAHAWLELGGRPLGETRDVERRFKPLVSLR